MHKTINSQYRNNNGWLLALLVVVVLAYSNTFHASWHLDDVSNILHNPNVQVSSLTAEELRNSVRTVSSGPDRNGLDLYRPVAMLTLAVNWYLGGASVVGYHVVNFAIHCLTAVLLFYTCLLLLRAPNMHIRSQSWVHMVAALATALWALHPIQTQAVTYIVQRMASLAAMFYLLGIFTYIIGRTAETRHKRFIMFGLCFLAFVFAIGSKQNAVTLPAALILIELIFYSDVKFLQRARGRWFAFGIVAAAGLLVGLILYMWSDSPLAEEFLKYNLRPFTLYERVLTQFKIITMYLFQIVYPIPQQFSVIHDVKLSTSLINPWTTIPAVTGILLLLGLAIGCMARYRLVAFAILFFFLGHSIESTILPLELVFEHRNYLPTLFLFLPFAAGTVALIDFYRRRNRALFAILSVCVPLLVAGLAFATYTRNMDWATEKTLWLAAMHKAPALARPYQALGMALENEGRLDEAYALYERALTLDDPEPRYSRFNSLSNMGKILKKKKEYVQAVRFLKEAIEFEKGPYANGVRFNLTLCLLNTGQEKESLEQINVLLDRESENSRYLTLKGYHLLLKDDVEEALRHLRRALKRNPYDINTLLNLGLALKASGALERGDWFLKRAEKQSPRSLIIHLSQLQNAIVMQDPNRMERRLFRIAKQFTLPEIRIFFNEHSKGYRYIDGMLVLVDDSIVLPAFVEYFKEKAGGGDLNTGDTPS